MGLFYADCMTIKVARMRKQALDCLTVKLKKSSDVNLPKFQPSTSANSLKRYIVLTLLISE